MFNDVFDNDTALRKFNDFRTEQSAVVDSILLSFVKKLDSCNYKVHQIKCPEILKDTWSDLVDFVIFSEDLPDVDFLVKFVFSNNVISCKFSAAGMVVPALKCERVLEKDDEILFVPDWSYSHLLTFSECIEIVADIKLDEFGTMITDAKKDLILIEENIRKHNLNQKKLRLFKLKNKFGPFKIVVKIDKGTFPHDRPRGFGVAYNHGKGTYSVKGEETGWIYFEGTEEECEEVAKGFEKI